MKSFKQFTEDTAGVPVNQTGSSVSTDQPVVNKKIANKYKQHNLSKVPHNVRFIRRTSPTSTT